MQKGVNEDWKMDFHWQGFSINKFQLEHIKERRFDFERICRFDFALLAKLLQYYLLQEGVMNYK